MSVVVNHWIYLTGLAVWAVGGWGLAMLVFMVVFQETRATIERATRARERLARKRATRTKDAVSRLHGYIKGVADVEGLL